MEITSTTFTTVSDFTDIDDLSVDIDLKIYPNPTTGLFSVEIPFLGEGQATIYSQTGHKVFEKMLENTYTFNIDLTDKSPGIYILIIRSSNHKFITSRKIILK